MGSHASIRFAERDIYPVLKLAHADELSLKLIRLELDILVDMSRSGLPTIEFDHRPVLGNGRVCGYRTRLLSKVGASELRSRCDEVENVLDQLHRAGFSHGDVNPSNIMKDETGQIVLIDLSFAGRLESMVPYFFPDWVYTDRRHTRKSDLEAWDKWKALI